MKLTTFGLLVTLFLTVSLHVYAEPRYALVIGNADYTQLGVLRNSVNDATDMASALRSLGFSVTLLTDATRPQMDQAILHLGSRVSESSDSVGFFFYAGHGVQLGGTNYLIPVNADIPDAAFLSERAEALQSILDILGRAGNKLNIFVLDACRDNPFSWSRGMNRGLAVVGNQPAGSIVAYAAGAGQVANDGSGRNGIFTGELLKNLRTSGLEIEDVFKRTGAAVSSDTNGIQTPAVYSLFYGNIYLAGQSTAHVSETSSILPKTPSGPTSPATNQPTFGAITIQTGSLSVSVVSAGTLTLDGHSVQIPAGGTLPISYLAPGKYELTISYEDGKKESRTVEVNPGEWHAVAFTYAPTTTFPKTAVDTSAISPETNLNSTQERVYRLGDRAPAGGFVFYDKGSYSDGWRYLEAAPVDQAIAVPWETGNRLTGIQTATSIGTGKSNTTTIVENLGDGDFAARICKGLRLGGFSDWFLPSKGELNAMYSNLKFAGIGGFAPQPYWSSSTFNQSDAWLQEFATGSQYYYRRDFPCYVRAVRAF